MKPKKPKRNARPAVPRRMSSIDLCKSLACIAAFHVEDKAAQMKIYEAVRRLQMLEKAAIDAGMLLERR